MQEDETTSGTVAVYAVVTLPMPWPLVAETEIFSGSLANEEFLLTATSSGGFRARITSPYRTLDVEFQPIEVVGGGFCFLNLSWSEASVAIELSKQVILPRALNQQILRVLTAFDKETNDNPLIAPNPSTIINPDDRYFVQTLLDIESKMKGDVYALVKASGMLRLVLLEGLISRINRSRKLKIRFLVVNHEMLNFGNMQWCSLLPSSASAPDKIVEVDLDELLALPVLKYLGSTVTVRELVRACANSRGGVHYGPPKEDEKPFVDWNQLFRVTGGEPSAIVIADLCRIVLNGLTPLVHEIGRAATAD